MATKATKKERYLRRLARVDLIYFISLVAQVVEEDVMCPRGEETEAMESN